MPQRERISIFANKNNSGASHPHTGSTGSAAGSPADSCTGIHPPGSDSRAGTCGCRHTRPYLSGAEKQRVLLQETDSALDQPSRRLPLKAGCWPTFTGLSVRIQRESTLAVAAEAPRRVLADAVVATQIGICRTFVVVCKKERIGWVKAADLPTDEIWVTAAKLNQQVFRSQVSLEPKGS